MGNRRWVQGPAEGSRYRHAGVHGRYDAQAHAARRGLVMS